VSLSDDEADAARSHLTKYYGKMGRTAPWEAEKWADRARRLLGIGKRGSVGMSREEVELVLASRLSVAKQLIASDLSIFGRDAGVAI